MFLKLNPNDIIDVIAPSSANFEVSLSSIDEFIASLGYSARYKKNMLARDVDPFSANTDEERFKQFLEALLAKDSKVIWAFRGGYGATRLIPMLEAHDFSKVPPKMIIGFSDITALHLYFYAKYGWPYLHSRVLTQYANCHASEDEIQSIKNILSGNWQEIKYALTPANDIACENNAIESEILGGNLSLLQCSLGTSWQINTSGKILFIEEVGEKGYRIHRMLEHLKQAGIFDHIEALIIGDIACASESDGSFLCENALVDFIGKADFPIFRTGQFGHGKENYPLLCGVPAKITDSFELVFDNV